MEKLKHTNCNDLAVLYPHDQCSDVSENPIDELQRQMRILLGEDEVVLTDEDRDKYGVLNEDLTIDEKATKDYVSGVRACDFLIVKSLGRSYFLRGIMKHLIKHFGLFENPNKVEPHTNTLGHDPVNHPSHYTSGKIEVIDYINDQNLNFELGNAVKYISRAGKKDPEKTIQDLEKAVWYISHEIKKLKEKE